VKRLRTVFIAALLAAIAVVAPAQTVVIDAAGSSHPFPHFWEQVFGSGRANLALRESYRRDLRAMRSATGIQYVRFHAIFHDENGVYDEDVQGRPVYNFSYVDQIYDGLLENGVRPFVELSFMPRKLSASPPVPHPFWYRPLVSPPKDYGKWGELIRAFAQHLVERYGIDEVAEWYRSPSTWWSGMASTKWPSGTSKYGMSRTSTFGRASPRSPATISSMRRPPAR